MKLEVLFFISVIALASANNRGNIKSFKSFSKLCKFEQSEKSLKSDGTNVLKFYYFPFEGYSSNVNLPNVGMAAAVETSSGSFSSGNKDCQDYMGRIIIHGMHFVPVGVDMCKLCICDNGVQKVEKSFFWI